GNNANAVQCAPMARPAGLDLDFRQELDNGMTASTNSQSDTFVRPVRAWIGYARDTRVRQGDRTPLYADLGKIIIPATAQCMEPWGLTAYLPTVLGEDHNSRVPDTVALLRYRSEDAYYQACSTSVAGRAYIRLLESVFRLSPQGDRPASHGGFVQTFPNNGEYLPERCYLQLPFAQADWSEGRHHVQVAVYEGGDLPAFRVALERRLAALRQPQAGTGLDDVILALDGPLVVLWTHWQTPAPGTSLLDDLPGLRTVTAQVSQPASVPASPLVAYDGLDVFAHSSFNIRAGFMN
ncbi:MAG: hypothetical protein WED00_15670, partial [Aquisalimonadaceae bacterium]